MCRAYTHADGPWLQPRCSSSSSCPRCPTPTPPLPPSTCHPSSPRPSPPPPPPPPTPPPPPPTPPPPPARRRRPQHRRPRRRLHTAAAAGFASSGFASVAAFFDSSSSLPPLRCPPCPGLGRRTAWHRQRRQHVNTGRAMMACTVPGRTNQRAAFTGRVRSDPGHVCHQQLHSREGAAVGHVRAAPHPIHLSLSRRSFFVPPPHTTHPHTHGTPGTRTQPCSSINFLHCHIIK